MLDGTSFINIINGFNVALSFDGILYCFIGVTLGTLVGVLPGIGPMATIAMLMPITYHLEPTFALIMLAGIYYGAAYGGSITSILLNLPGEASASVTALDGYPMAQQGRAGIALFITAIASFIGSIIGMILLGLFAKPLSDFAIEFSAPEYFSLMLLGLIAATMVSSDAPFRALAMVTFGLVLGLVGVDLNSGMSRFTFGVPDLFDGLSLVALAIGLFGLPELFFNATSPNFAVSQGKGLTLRSMLPTRQDWKDSWAAILRGSGIGSFFGALPGTGGVIASFMSYAVEKKVSRDPSRFGKGAIEGIASPEAANNAAVQTAFIPALSLGVPSNAVMALMLGVMMIHGVAPGPNLINESPDLFWGLVVSFLVGNVLLVILNIPLIGTWVRVLSIPFNILLPIIIGLICVGVYSVNNSVIDVYVAIGFGLLGYAMRLLRFEPAPLVLGFVLGPMMEENFRRAMVLSGGSYSQFVDRPISLSLLICCVAVVGWTLFSALRRRMR